MGLTGWSISNYLTAAVVGAEPFMAALWCYSATGLGINRVAYCLGQSGIDVNCRRSIILTDDTGILAQSADGSTSDGPEYGAAHPNNAWFHVAAAWTSSTSRTGYENATSTGANTTSLVPGTPDITIVGRAGNAEFPWASAGALAELSVWNCTGMSTGNQDSLASKLYNGGAGGAGGNPLKINAESSQPWTGKLLGYWPLISTSDVTDKSTGGHNMTMQGTLTNFGTHPTIEAFSSATPINVNLTPDRLDRRQVWP